MAGKQYGKYQDKKVLRYILHFNYSTKQPPCNYLIISTYKGVRFCYTILYTFICQYCTFLHNKSVQSYPTEKQ